MFKKSIENVLITLSYEKNADETFLDGQISHGREVISNLAKKAVQLVKKRLLLSLLYIVL